MPPLNPSVYFFRVLREQWVRAKYEREEFIHIDRQTYLSGKMEGYLWKRGREDGRFQCRKFVLSEVDNVFKYYVKDVSMELISYLKGILTLHLV